MRADGRHADRQTDGHGLHYMHFLPTRCPNKR